MCDGRQYLPLGASVVHTEASEHLTWRNAESALDLYAIDAIDKYLHPKKAVASCLDSRKTY